MHLDYHIYTILNSRAKCHQYQCSGISKKMENRDLQPTIINKKEVIIISGSSGLIGTTLIHKIAPHYRFGLVRQDIKKEKTEIKIMEKEERN